MLQDPSDAEDVTQTTFLNAYRAFERGERPRSAQNWLIAIAHNVCRQRFRQASRRPAEVMLEDDHGSVPVEESVRPSPQEIRRALGYLPFNQRSALVMRELEGRSYADIAQVLGVSIPAVEALIFRARRALREQLEGRLTCEDAERAIFRQLDGALSRSEKGALRAHLRECSNCATFARRQRAQRAAFKGLALVPLPGSLTSFFSAGTAGGAATVGVASGSGVLAKAAAVAAAGVVATGVTYKGLYDGASPRPAQASSAQASSAQAGSHGAAPVGGPVAEAAATVDLPAPETAPAPADRAERRAVKSGLGRVSTRGDRPAKLQRSVKSVHARVAKPVGAQREKREEPPVAREVALPVSSEPAAKRARALPKRPTASRARGGTRTAAARRPSRREQVSRPRSTRDGGRTKARHGRSQPWGAQRPPQRTSRQSAPGQARSTAKGESTRRADAGTSAAEQASKARRAGPKRGHASAPGRIEKALKSRSPSSPQSAAASPANTPPAGEQPPAAGGSSGGSAGSPPHDGGSPGKGAGGGPGRRP